MNSLVLRGKFFRNEWRSHVLAYAFAMNFLFGSVKVLNLLGLYFFYYYPRRIEIAIIDPRIDILVWALSAACLSILAMRPCGDRRKDAVRYTAAGLAIGLAIVLIVNPTETVVYALFAVAATEFALLALSYKRIPGQSTGTFVFKVLIYLLALFLAIEVSSGTHYILRSFNRTTWIGKTDAEIELQLSYASYGLLPWLYTAFLFSWAWVPPVQTLLSKIFQSSLKKAFASDREMLAPSPSGSGLSSLLDYRLFAALAFAAFIGYYPYFQNPPWLVGTDAYWRYYDPLVRMNERGVAGGFIQALEEKHPLPLALLYAVQLFFQTTAFEVVRFAPLFLVVALAFSMWWFLARRMSARFGLIVFMLSILSVTTTVGMHSSILANWMALVVWMSFFAYIAFRSDKKFRALDAIALLVMSTLILFIHPWTWGVFAASVMIVAIITIFQEKRKGLFAGAILIDRKSVV